MITSKEICQAMFQSFLIFSGNTLNIVGPRYVNEFLCPDGIMRVSLFDHNVLMLLVNSSFRLSGKPSYYNALLTNFAVLNCIFSLTCNQFNLITSITVAYRPSVKPAAQFITFCKRLI